MLCVRRFIGFMNLRCVYGWRLCCLFALLYWLSCRGRLSIALNFFGSMCLVLNLSGFIW